MTVFPSLVCLIHESKTGHSILLCSDSSSKETLCIKTPVSSPVRNKLLEKENTSVPQFTPVAEMRQPAVIATLRMTLDPLALRLCFSTDLPLYQILQSLQYYDSFFPLKSQSLSPFFSFLALFSNSAISVPSIRQGFVQNAPKPAEIQGFWRIVLEMLQGFSIHCFIRQNPILYFSVYLFFAFLAWFCHQLFFSLLAWFLRSCID